jgi:hypothetical protein
LSEELGDVFHFPLSQGEHDEVNEVSGCSCDRCSRRVVNMVTNMVTAAMFTTHIPNEGDRCRCHPIYHTAAMFTTHIPNEGDRCRCHPIYWATDQTIRISQTREFQNGCNTIATLQAVARAILLPRELVKTVMA